MYHGDDGDGDHDDLQHEIIKRKWFLLEKGGQQQQASVSRPFLHPKPPPIDMLIMYNGLTMGNGFQWFLFHHTCACTPLAFDASDEEDPIILLLASLDRRHLATRGDGKVRGVSVSRRCSIIHRVISGRTAW